MVFMLVYLYHGKHLGLPWCFFSKAIVFLEMFLRDDGEARVLKTGSEAWRDSRVEEADTIRLHVQRWRKTSCQVAVALRFTRYSYIYIFTKKTPLFFENHYDIISLWILVTRRLRWFPKARICYGRPQGSGVAARFFAMGLFLSKETDVFAVLSYAQKILMEVGKPTTDLFGMSVVQLLFCEDCHLPSVKHVQILVASNCRRQAWMNPKEDVVFVR